jgi:phytoene synthase
MSMLSRRGRLSSPHVTNFYYAFVFLPRQKRRAIEAVYAFARRGDDLVDSGLESEAASREMARYRQALEQCYAERDGVSGDADLQALADAVRRYNIPRQPFDDLILGLEMDLATRRYETFEELALYCYRVASTIGLIAVEIFGYRNPRARDYAVNLGMALQMVNILRDLESDGRRGRVYLPREDLERFGVRPEELLAASYNDPFIELMQFECDRARHYFDLARQMLPREDRRALVAAEIMAAIYWRLLRRIHERRYNIFGERVRLSRPLKFWIALSVYLGAEWHK